MESLDDQQLCILCCNEPGGPSYLYPRPGELIFQQWVCCFDGSNGKLRSQRSLTLHCLEGIKVDVPQTS